MDKDDLFEAIEESFKLDQENRERHGEETVAIQKVESLSAREREVMTYVITGMLNKQIAGELNISLETVKNHRGRVMHKLGVVSVVELIHLCKNAGIEAADVDNL